MLLAHQLPITIHHIFTIEKRAINQASGKLAATKVIEMLSAS